MAPGHAAARAYGASENGEAGAGESHRTRQVEQCFHVVNCLFKDRKRYCVQAKNNVQLLTLRLANPVLAHSFINSSTSKLRLEYSE